MEEIYFTVKALKNYCLNICKIYYYEKYRHIQELVLLYIFFCFLNFYFMVFINKSSTFIKYYIYIVILKINKALLINTLIFFNSSNQLRKILEVYLEIIFKAKKVNLWTKINAKFHFGYLQ